jgi:hypothetical protein
LQFGFQFSPTHCAAPILIEGIQAPLKFRLLRGGQWKVILFKAVPKLCDKRKAFRRRHPRNLVGQERPHAFRVRENRLGDKI